MSMLAALPRPISFIDYRVYQSRDEKWIADRLSEMQEALKHQSLTAEECVNSMETFKALGLLKGVEGKLLLRTLKSNIIEQFSTLKKFETVGLLMEAVPKAFKDEELEELKESYGEFTEKYATDYDEQNPDEIRGEVETIDYIGDLLKVDTQELRDVLNGTADKIEEENERNRDWDREDDESRGAGGTDHCPDSEIESMFGTLK